MSYAIKLIANDLRNILRDNLYVFVFVLYPALIVVLTRFVVPWISESVYDLRPFYPALFVMLMNLIPMLFGFITAFLIMDERDEKLLTVLRVMPISRSGYLIYRMMLMSLFAFVYVTLFPLLTGLVGIPFLLHLPIAALFAMLVPVIALMINILASNKVQGFAIMKMSGGVFILPLFAFFIVDGLKYVFGLVPNFWAFMAFNNAITNGTHDLLHLGIGFAFNIVLIAVLFRMFNEKF